jgi:hypothetical protein
MMKFTWPSRRPASHSTVEWQTSSELQGVSFAVRKASLGERIDLTAKLRDLCQQHDFLRAGDAADQLEASLGEMLVTRTYLEWGLLHVRGLQIDGRRATPESVIEHGPEPLTGEIAAAIKAELGLTDEERKNS